MTTRWPSLDGLRAFETVARLGSFERAAEALNITASAVSKRIATLEELLETPLLLRSSKAVSLTPAGKDYLTEVASALNLLAGVALHQRGTLRPRLRVISPPTFARQIMVPHLHEFTQAHPEVDLELVLSVPYLSNASVDADVEVRHGDPAVEAGTLLMSDVVIAVAAPRLLDRFAPLHGPADLARLPLIRTPLEPWMPWWRAAGLAWGEPTEGPRYFDLGLTLEAAVRGQGVALARPSLARDWLNNGSLVPLFPISAQPAYAYQCLCNTVQAEGRAFAAWLQRRCESITAAAGSEWVNKFSADT